jgi:hypothetical protein
MSGLRDDSRKRRTPTQVVIPAALNSGAGQAGIQLDLISLVQGKMDSRFAGMTAALDLFRTS